MMYNRKSTPEAREEGERERGGSQGSESQEVAALSQ